MGVTIPDKTYFKIGEAASLVGVEPYTIRYWEKEFKSLKPAKTKSRQRLFRQRDVQLLLVIRHLLYEHRFTIDGARRRLRDLATSGHAVEDVLTALEGGRLLDGTAPAGAAAEAREAPDGAALEAARGEVARLNARVRELEVTAAKDRAAAQAYGADRERLQHELARERARDAEARGAMARCWRGLLDGLATGASGRRVDVAGADE